MCGQRSNILQPRRVARTPDTKQTTIARAISTLLHAGGWNPVLHLLRAGSSVPRPSTPPDLCDRLGVVSTTSLPMHLKGFQHPQVQTHGHAVDAVQST